jgi:hypothetical protein
LTQFCADIFSEEMINLVEMWRAKQKPVPNVSEAIRRLVEFGLTVNTPAKAASNPGRKLRAQELATSAIETIIDPSAPADERAQRRRRLTKGPEEFREVRVDKPKAKQKA